MNIRDLTYLTALAEHRHFGKAAEACYVSQPALSMQIKKLETYLGVQLLERTSKSVLLTEVGKVLADKARHILHHVDEMREIAKLATDPYSGQLKLGIVPTLAPYLLPLVLSPLSKAFPNLVIYLVEEKSMLLADRLNQGTLDAMLIGLSGADIGFETTRLFQEEFMLAVPHAHPLAKRKTIDQDELDDQGLLLLEEGHCLGSQALKLCATANKSNTQNFRATSLETLRYMVAAGAGITLMPALACKNNDGIAYVPFTTPKPVRTIGMAWRDSTAKKVVLDEVVGMIKKMAAKQKQVKVI